MKNKIGKNWIFWVYFLGFLGFFARVWSLALFMDDFGLRSGWIASWADGAVHLTYMSAFAYRNFFPKVNPIFVGKRFVYPFVSDMMGGYLVKLGLPLHVSYNLIGFLFSMFLVYMVWRLFEKLFENKKASFIGALVFFFGAGLTSLEKIVPAFYKSVFDTYDWVDIISAQIMPQRSLILGMPVGILVFLIVYEFYKSKKIRVWKLMMAGVLTGLMSLIHTHSLMALFFIVSGLFVMDIWENKKINAGWLWYGLPSVVLGAYFVLGQIGSFDSRFFRLLPFWLANTKDENLLWFWVKSWGIWPVMAYLGFIKLEKKRRFLFVPLMMLFILLNLFSFQPYEWDNTKLFLWIYLFGSGLVGSYVAKLSGKKLWLAMILFVMMTFSGLIDSLKLLSAQDDPVLYLFTHEDVGLAEEIRENTSPESVFLTSTYHLNLVPVLTGRQIVMGYPGWLWTYGIDYENRLEEVEKMYVGGVESEKLMDKYGVDYVVFDDVINASVEGASERYFAENYLLRLKSNKYRIYEIVN